MAACKANGAYADCFSVDVNGAVSLEQFVAAFYSSGVFKLERLILKWAVSKPSTDAQAQQLARGDIDAFAAWRVEQRNARQLLADFQGRTKSWLMVAPVGEDIGEAIGRKVGSGTRLYFGASVVPIRDRVTGKSSMGFLFRALLGFHTLYSRMLLRAAASRV